MGYFGTAKLILIISILVSLRLSPSSCAAAQNRLSMYDDDFYYHRQFYPHYRPPRPNQFLNPHGFDFLTGMYHRPRVPHHYHDLMPGEPHFHQVPPRRPRPGYNQGYFNSMPGDYYMYQ